MSIQQISTELQPAINVWEEKLLVLPVEVISERKNKQSRSIKQIVGHMVDSASNNTHRVVHLHYRASPVEFPNYATYGNNDRWISIQNYQTEDWQNLVKLWKYAHLHFLHVINNIDTTKLQSKWLADENVTVSLEEMVLDFPRHFHLHLSEIDELINFNA